jgi:hypothetical protein
VILFDGDRYAIFLKITLVELIVVFGIIRRHYIFLSNLSLVKYLFAVTSEMLVCTFFLGFIFARIFPGDERSFDLPFPYLVVVAMTLGPIIETFLAQLVPYELMGALSINRLWSFYVSWLIFFSMHLSIGFETALTAGLVGGFFLSATYYIWRRKSLRLAYVATLSCHALVNGTLLGIMYCVK